MVLPRGQPILETNGLCRLCGWVVGYRCSLQRTICNDLRLGGWIATSKPCLVSSSSIFVDTLQTCPQSR